MVTHWSAYVLAAPVPAQWSVPNKGPLPGACVRRIPKTESHSE